jgi:hypothetical protein
VGRLLPWMVLLALVAGLGWAWRRLGAPPPTHAGRTYRPRASRRPASAAAAPGQTHVLSRSRLAGLRDAYSSAPVDSRQPLASCARCQAVYQLASLAALRHDNGGRCAVCGGTDIGPVTVID